MFASRVSYLFSSFSIFRGAKRVAHGHVMALAPLLRAALCAKRGVVPKAHRLSLVGNILSPSVGRRQVSTGRDEYATGGFSGDAFFRPKGQQAYSASGALLSPGWCEHRSPARGIYYSHSPSGVTQWDVPTSPPTKAQLEQHHRAQFGADIAKLQPGKAVILRGLVSAPQLNGKTGICEQWDYANSLVRVRLSTGELKAIKPEFLVVQESLDFRLEHKKWFESQRPADQRPKPGQKTISGNVEEPRLVERTLVKVLGAGVLAVGAWYIWCSQTRAAVLSQLTNADAYFDPVAQRWRQKGTGRLLPKSFGIELLAAQRTEADFFQYKDGAVAAEPVVVSSAEPEVIRAPERALVPVADSAAATSAGAAVVHAATNIAAAAERPASAMRVE